MIFVAMSLYIHTWPWLGDSVWRMSNTRMQLLWLLCKVMFSQIIWPSLIPDLASLDTLNPTWWETWHWCPRKNHWPCPNFLNPTSASYKMHILELRASKIWNGLWWKTIPPPFPATHTPQNSRAVKDLCRDLPLSPLACQVLEIFYKLLINLEMKYTCFNGQCPWMKALFNG